MKEFPGKPNTRLSFRVKYEIPLNMSVSLYLYFVELSFASICLSSAEANVCMVIDSVA